MSFTRAMAESKAWRRALLCLSFALSACVVSPQPSPPELEPLLGDGIDLIDGGTEDLSDLMGFEAEPGSVIPATGSVIVTNLDTDDAPSTSVVRDDGSFSIALRAVPGDTIRFQVDQDGARSEPVDIAVDDVGQTSAVSEDAPSCLVIDPARFVALPGSGAARSIVISNDCTEAVRIASPRLRRGRGPFTFSPTQPILIEAGDVAFVTVRVAGTADESEDVLLLDILEPEIARRAITLTVPE